MTIEWTPVNKIQTGVDRGVLYLPSGAVPWNGLVQITQKAEDPSVSVLYYDGSAFAHTQSPTEFGLTVECWAYPDEFDPYLGYVDDLETKQPGKPFDLTWRVDVGDAHQIHLVWNARAVDQGQPYSSKNNELEVTMLTWDIFTTPKVIEGIQPTAHMVVDTDLAPEEAVEALETMLYEVGATLPTPEEVIDLFLSYAVLIITDNGDGTWTATGPDDVLVVTGNKFVIKWPSALYTTPVKYKVSTL